MVSMSHRAPYTGSSRKLVLSFDLGIKASRVSYSILEPGQVPKIKGVTRFPAHEQVSGAPKVPTVIYYDNAGLVCAVGAETMTEGVWETAEREQWVKAEWFMLHIRPKPGSSLATNDTQKIPPLPAGKTVVQVLADFLQYLRKCAEAYVKDTHSNGRYLWESLASEIDYVISHPNGWEGHQQSQILDAAVIAGLIPDTTCGHRVSFVAEGKATLHFAMDNALPTGAMQTGDGAIVVDAGEGNVDISAYSIKTLDPDTDIEEIAVPQSHLQGSYSVSIRARLFLDGYLKNSRYHSDLDSIVESFDKKNKIRFNSDKEAQSIKFGSTRDNDAACNIRFGKLKLAGTDVATFFEPSVTCIVDSVQAQIKNGHNPIKCVVLVGGFSASDWLFVKVNEALNRKGIVVFRPGGHLDKYKSDGAISFYLSNLVRIRIATAECGSSTNGELQAREKENWEREISRMRESMDLEMEAVRDELDVERKECSDAKNALEQAKKELVDVNDALQRSREEAQNLAVEKKKLSNEMSRLKESLALSRKESRSTAKRSREEQQVQSPVPSLLNLQSIILSGGTIHNSGVGDRVSIDEAMDLVRNVNLQIVKTASALVGNLISSRMGYPTDPLAPPTSTRSLNSTQVQEAEWLLGREELTSLLDFVPAPKSSAAGLTKDGNQRLKTLLQIGLTTWSAYHVHSWELGWNGSSAAVNTKGPSLPPPPPSLPTSSDGSNVFAVIYRKLKLGEDPAVTTKWRSVTRSQIKFSASAWTRALISSLFGIFSFLGLTYTRSNTLAQELQPLVTAIRSVREALGESVVSKELEVVTVTPGVRFDSRCMKDTLPTDPSTLTRSSTERPKQETVVATCGLGLKEVSLDDVGSEKLLVLPLVLRESSFCDL